MVTGSLIRWRSSHRCPVEQHGQQSSSATDNPPPRPEALWISQTAKRLCEKQTCQSGCYGHSRKACDGD
ncbi:hypothetical protein VTO42DRAFT_7256 [Malbranchea cinnamomea]